MPLGLNELNSTDLFSLLKGIIFLKEQVGI